MLDVNAVVALVYADYDAHADVRELVRRLVAAGTRPLFNVSSMNELYYVLRHNARRELRLDHGEALARLDAVSRLLELVGTTAGVCRAAIASDEPDYEDAVVRAAAEARRCDVIVTYDRAAFRGSAARSLTAREALDELVGRGSATGGGNPQ